MHLVSDEDAKVKKCQKLRSGPIEKGETKWGGGEK